MKKLLFLISIIALVSCKDNESKFKEKGFQVEDIETVNDSVNPNAIKGDSLNFKTRSVDVLLTGNPNVRISPLYKINYSEKYKEFFTGSNDFHYNFDDTQEKGNHWESLIPGFEAVFGYNMVNMYHFDHAKNSGHNIFAKPVLIKTCYYPTFDKDSLNFKPVQRNFYMISAYDEDTNKDKFINIKDLRRFYLFDENGENQQAIVPKNFSVTGAKYDSANDFIYVNASRDANNNGNIDKNEPFSVFYLDLKNPANRGVFYENK